MVVFAIICIILNCFVAQISFFKYSKVINLMEDTFNNYLTQYERRIKANRYLSLMVLFYALSALAVTKWKLFSIFGLICFAGSLLNMIIWETTSKRHKTKNMIFGFNFPLTVAVHIVFLLLTV